MGRSYIPSKDADCALWAANFAAVLAANPASYGFAAADATIVTGYVNAYTAALTLVRDPATNTAPNVAAKDGAKAAMLDIIRGYAVPISISAGISALAKAAIGVTVRDTTPTPVPAPTTIPVVSIISALPNQITFAMKDSGSGAPRAKPTGAIGMLFFVKIGTAVATDPSQPDMVIFETRTPFTVDFEPADVGKKATVFGRWQTRTGLVGPWSSGTSMSIPG